MKRFFQLLMAIMICLNTLSGISVYAADYSDYTPGDKPANMITGMTPCYDDGYETSDGGFAPKRGTNTNTYWIPGGFMSSEKLTLEASASYLFHTKAKNYAPDVTENPILGISLGEVNILDMSVTIQSTELVDINLTLSAPDNPNSSSDRLYAGMTDENIENAQIWYELPYLAPEIAYNITNELTSGQDAVDPGSVLSFKAGIVNQLEVEGNIEQGTFTWKILNENRTAEVTDGFTVTPADDEVTIDVGADVTPGKYIVLACSDIYDGFQRGVEITVNKPVLTDVDFKNDGVKDYKLTAEVSGDATMGIFDTLSISAAIGNNEGDTEGYEQNFTWYVTDDTRKDILEDAGIIILPAGNSSSVEISLEKSVNEGTYYIIVESTAAESLKMRKGIQIVVDKSSTNADIITALNTDSAETIAENITEYCEILGVDIQQLGMADVNEWANIIENSLKDNALDTDDADAVKSLIKQAAIVSLYNSNENNVQLNDSDGRFIYEAELGLDTIDTEGVTIYSLYDNIMSDEGRDSVIEALSGKDIATVDEFVKKVTGEILLKTIQYPSSLGTGYMESVLTEENLIAVGITDVDNYFDLDDKSEIHSELSGKALTLEKLKEKLSDAAEPEEDNDTNRKSKKSSSGGSYSVDFSLPSSTITSTEEVADEPADEITKMMLSYEDVSDSHWAYDDIYHLTMRGIFSGKDAEHFAPDANISREEFVKLICVAFELENSDAPVTFNDVVSGAWYEDYVKTAVAHGIVNGISEDTFGVGNAITRQDICVMLVRALGEDVSGSEGEIEFEDAEEISDYARASVRYLSSLGAVNGFEDGTFRPVDTCTRAQAAKILRMVLSIGGVLNND